MNAPLPFVISGEGIGAGVGLTWAQAAVAVMQSAPAAASAARVPVIWQIRLMASTSWALKVASPMPWEQSRRSYRSVGLCLGQTRPAPSRGPVGFSRSR